MIELLPFVLGYDASNDRITSLFQDMMKLMIELPPFVLGCDSINDRKESDVSCSSQYEPHVTVP